MAEQDALLERMQRDAAYRAPVAGQIASLLTGGLYGMLSGQSERQANAQAARQAIQREQMLTRRMQAMKQEQLANAIALQEAAQAERENVRKEKAQEELGQTRAFLRGRGVDIGEPDIETARMMETQIKQRDIEEERKQKEENAFLTVNTGAGTFQGPAKYLQDLAKTNPALAAAMAGQGKTKGGPKVTVTYDPMLGTSVPRVEFPEGTTPQDVQEFMRGFEPLNAATPKKQPEPQPAASGLGKWWQSVFSGGKQSEEQQQGSLPGYTWKVKQ